jgi:membrane-associated phospholipid phosphatase
MLAKKYLSPAIALFIGAVLLGWLASFEETRGFNLWFSQLVQSFQPEWLVLLARFISAFEIGVYLMIIPAVYMFFRKGNRREDIFIAGATLLSLSANMFKRAFSVICPYEPWVNLHYDFRSISEYFYSRFGDISIFKTPFCYPSGHVFSYMLLLGMIIYLRNFFTSQPSRQKAIKAIGLFLIFGVGVARVILGAHWLTDVLGGYMFGGSLLLLLIYLYETGRTVNSPPVA